MITEATVQLVAEALDRLDGLVVPPMPEVDRATYDQFAEIVTRLRGKWKRGKGHVFEYDPSAALRAVIETRAMPDKNPLAYFPTPMELAKDLVSLVSPQLSRMRVLEPSAGSGNLVEAIRERWPSATITAVEADPINAAQLLARKWPLPEWCDEAGDIKIIGRDFLALGESELGGKFDLAIMNPPFSVGGDAVAWETHMRHAWSLLEDGGALMCIAPAGTWETSTRKRFVELRAWLDKIGAAILRLDDDEFLESGTRVKALAIYAYKVRDHEWLAPHNGYPSFFSWAGWLMIDNDEELHRRARELANFEADPNGTEFRQLYIDAARAWNKDGTVGLPITETYLGQMGER